jgi:hypothetical protein
LAERGAKLSVSNLAPFTFRLELEKTTILENYLAMIQESPSRSQLPYSTLVGVLVGIW